MGRRLVSTSRPYRRCGVRPPCRPRCSRDLRAAGGRFGRRIPAGPQIMNVALLYLLLLKGTWTAFAGLASLPGIHDTLVTHYQVLTDQQLNEAVVITRSTPGPVGLYIVSVGYFVAGMPGAIAACLAMITPAVLIIPLVH